MNGKTLALSLLLTGALVARFTSLGGELRTGAEVSRIVVHGGRVRGVTTHDGGWYAAPTVVADVAAPHLFGGLVREEDLPARVVRGMRDFELDPGTVKVDWALSGPVPWTGRPERVPGTVHVGDSVEEILDNRRNGVIDEIEAVSERSGVLYQITLRATF